MGWLWSLFFCHSAATRILVLAAMSFGLTSEAAAEQVAVEGRPAPQLGKRTPLLAPYVDNLNIILYDREDYESFKSALASVLVLFGLAFRFECDGETAWTTLGVVLDVGQRVLYGRPLRAWRVRAAIQALRLQGHCAGSALRVVLGPAIYLLQVVRHTLSVLWHSFQFVVQHLDTDWPFDSYVDGELRVVAGLIVFLHVDLRATVSTQVMCTDSL